MASFRSRVKFELDDGLHAGERKIVRCGLESLYLSFRESEFSIEVLSDSLTDFLKPLIASPRDLPNSGSLLGPKTTKATTKITISSGIPRLQNIQYLLTL